MAQIHLNMPKYDPKWPKIIYLSEIWDLHANLGLFWDQIWTLVPFETKSQIWDFIGAPVDDV